MNLDRILEQGQNFQGNQESFRKSYVIKGIKNKKKIRGKTMFKVEWADGHPDTYEPASNFINCDKVLKEFNDPTLKRKQFVDLRYGDIEYDIPIRILTRSPNDDLPDDIAFLVEWRIRDNGAKPKESICMREKLKKKFPLILIKYYEKHIIFESK